jgi:5-methylthioribose kinase
MTQAQQPADLPAGPPDPALLQALLRRHGLLNAGETIQIRSLGGGVSNNVLRVDTPRQAIVIKQSLPKLRVEMDWFADQARIWRERDYLLLLGAWMPANAPRVLFSDPAHFILAMTAVGDATLWKTTLMAGRCDPQGVTPAAGVGRSISTRRRLAR